MKYINQVLVAALLITAPVQFIFAEGMEDEAVESSEISKSKWHDEIQSKYELNDDEMKKLEDSGLNHAQQTKAAKLASSSGKSVEEVLKMRTEDKMGWGQIAKKLGVHPGALGKANKGLKKSAERRAERAEKRTAKLEKKVERRASKAEKKGHGRKK